MSGVQILFVFNFIWRWFSIFRALIKGSEFILIGRLFSTFWFMESFFWGAIISQTILFTNLSLRGMMKFW